MSRKHDLRAALAVIDQLLKLLERLDAGYSQVHEVAVRVVAGEALSPDDAEILRQQLKRSRQAAAAIREQCADVRRELEEILP